MFEDVTSEKALRELNKLFGNIRGKAVVTPTLYEHMIAHKTLENRLKGEGTIHNDYVNRIFMAYNYAKTHVNKETGHTLLEDINNGLDYYVDNYV